MTALDVAYNMVMTEPSDVFDHLPYFETLCEDLQATKIIELGVRYGVSTVVWIKAMEKNGGHLWAVDGAAPVEEPTFHFDLLNPLMGLPQWTFVLGWDTEQSVLDQLPTDVDILFIDTNHIYEETLVELDLYLPRVRPGGHILLHDTAIETTGNAAPGQWQPPFPVLTAVTEFCAERNLSFTNVEYCCGLGDISVP